MKINKRKLCLLVSAIYVIILFIWGFSGDLKLNEFGDFFAGFTAPLALTWLIAGYIQQGD